MQTRTSWLLSITVTGVVVAAAVLLGRTSDAVRPTVTTPSVSSRALVRDGAESGVAVLRAWDRRRAAAWAAGDTAALRGLYVPGSHAGRSDVAMLTAYVRRGLRVTTMQRQLLAVRLRGRSERRLALVVTDRLVEGRVTGRGVRLVLPRSGVATRRIVLRRTLGRWRVAEVYDS